MSFDAPNPGPSSFEPPRPPQRPGTTPPMAPPLMPTPPPMATPPTPPPGATQQAAGFEAPQFLEPSSSPATQATEVKRDGGMRAAMVAAVVAVGAGGGFATYSALQGPSGPASPSEAIDQLFAAADAEDVLGMAELLLPAEREAFVEPSLESYAHLQRLGLLADHDLSAYGAMDIEVDGITYTVETLNDEVSWVTLTGGTVTTTSEGRSMVGPLITDRWPEMIDDLGDEPVTETETFGAGNEMSLAVVERDGSWYVSLSYTLAEQIRRDEGLGLPDFDQAPTPVGASDPGAAVSALVAQAVELDLDGILTTLDPEEFGALYDYSPLVLDRAQREVDELVAEMEAEGVDWSMSVTSTRVEERNGRTVVLVDGMDLEVTGPDVSYRVHYADGCSTVEVETSWGGAGSQGFESQELQSCIDDPVDPQLEEFVGAEMAAELRELGVLQAMSGYEAGITVVERDGGWFVSGYPTFAGAFNDLLARLDRQDLEEAIDFATELGAFAEQRFIDVEESIGGSEDDRLTEDEGWAEENDAGERFAEIEDAITEDVATEELPEIDLPAGYDQWTQSPDTWWLGWLYELPEPEALATVWVGDDYVDVARMVDAVDGQTVHAALSENAVYPLGVGSLDGLDPSASVLADDSQIVVIVDRWVLTGFTGGSEEALVELANALIAGGS